MNIRYWNQPKTASLEKILNEKLKKGFSNVLIVAGMTKDSGMDLIYDSIKAAKELGSDVSVMLGVDRKNTSKDMLMKLLDMECNLYVHINREESKVETRVYVFENEDAESYVYLSSGKFSEGGLTTNQCLIQEICYENEDRKAFENFKAVLLQGTENVFKSVDREEVMLLAEKGEIVARITERKIPSISELYGEPSLNSISNNDMYDESAGTKLFDLPLDNDIDIDVDFSMAGDVKKSEFIAEIEGRKDAANKELLESSSAKLAKFYEVEQDEESEDKKVSIIKDFNDIDFKHTKIFAFDINKIVTSGTGKGEIKVPHYLFENLSEFFKCAVESENAVVKFNIKDIMNKTNSADEEAQIYDAGRHLAIKSEVLNSMDLQENDIMRMIKDGNNEYTIEIIRKGSDEYEVWDSLCKYQMKNSKRCFGIM